MDNITHKIVTFAGYTNGMVEVVTHGGKKYLRIDPQMINFDTAVPIHKVTDDYAVRITADEQDIPTVINGHLETINDARAGDWRVYNIGNTDPDSIPGYQYMSAEEQILARAKCCESYILSDESFKASHTDIRPLGDGVIGTPAYIERPAMTLPFNAVFKPSWGDDEFVKAGGYMVKNGAKIYGIEQVAMQRTYGAIGETEPFSETQAAQIFARKPLLPEALFKPEVRDAYLAAARAIRQKD